MKGKAKRDDLKYDKISSRDEMVEIIKRLLFHSCAYTYTQYTYIYTLSIHVNTSTSKYNNAYTI